MTGRDVLYMLAALAALLLAIAAPPASSPCHESPRGDWHALVLVEVPIFKLASTSRRAA